MRGRARLIIAAVAAFLFLLLTYFFLVSPKRSELGDLREQVTAEEERTAGLQGELARLQELQEQEPQLRADLATLEELVPKRHEIPNFIFLVQEAANRSGVGFVQITPELPKSPPEGAALAEVRIAIGARGGYFAIQDFVRRLYELDRALRIDLLAMSAEQATEDAATRIALDITARIFFEVPTEAAPVTTGTAPAPDPAASPTEVPAEGEDGAASPSPSPAG